MEYRKMDNLGVDVSLLGFGCMRFPLKKDGSINAVRARQMIDLAYQNGVNYFDTAYGYHNGESESFTGSALKKYDRKTFYLATKLPHWLIKTTEDVERIFNEQLGRLQTDYIDFYLLHAMNRNAFDRMVSLGALEVLERMRTEGKIRFIGFSFHDDYDAFSYILNYRAWDFCQIQLNYMDTEEQAGLKGYELTEKLNVPLIIMEPVKGGLLSRLPSAAIRKLKALDPDRSVSSWALRWVASLPNVKVVLSGMSSKHQVLGNLSTFDSFVPLSDRERQTVDEVVKFLNKRIKNGCTNCRYCMPCPAGVNIPHNFRIWNDYGVYRNPYHTRWHWLYGIDDSAKAKNCIECGQCEQVCPQKLSIRENLKSLQEEIDNVVASLPQE
jgi:predicted aldo/keto reductase-like oxidoreductase